jgi:hypothetical protein
MADADFFGDGAIRLFGVSYNSLFRALTSGYVGQATVARGVGKRPAALASQPEAQVGGWASGPPGATVRTTPTGPAKPQAWRNPSGWRRLRCRPLVAKSAPDIGRYPRPEPKKRHVRNDPICGIIRLSDEDLLCGAYYVELRPSELDDAEGTSA